MRPSAPHSERAHAHASSPAPKHHRDETPPPLLQSPPARASPASRESTSAPLPPWTRYADQSLAFAHPQPPTPQESRSGCHSASAVEPPAPALPLSPAVSHRAPPPTPHASATSS